jgi:ABC-type spermidine/putrescine transport system permease subunit I
MASAVAVTLLALLVLPIALLQRYQGRERGAGR